MSDDDILVFGGSGSPRLTSAICEFLDCQPGDLLVHEKDPLDGLESKGS